LCAKYGVTQGKKLNDDFMMMDNLFVRLDSKYLQAGDFQGWNHIREKSLC
jgi:hypothetical protein